MKVEGEPKTVWERQRRQGPASYVVIRQRFAASETVRRQGCAQRARGDAVPEGTEAGMRCPAQKPTSAAKRATRKWRRVVAMTAISTVSDRAESSSGGIRSRSAERKVAKGGISTQGLGGSRDPENVPNFQWDRLSRQGRPLTLSASRRRTFVATNSR
jgi:hypothetical protein